jgi:hypothetical protein
MLASVTDPLEDTLKNLSWLLVLGLCGAAPAAGAQSHPAEPPASTRALLREATAPFDERDFTGSYTVRSHRITSKKNGDDREERDELFEMQQSAPDTLKRTLVRATLNEQDVIEVRRVEVAEEDAKGRRRQDPLKLPTDEHDLFVFRALEPEGELCVSHFEPKPEASDEDRITHGRFAWNCQTGDPVWLEAEFVDNPMLVEELSISWRFTRFGEMMVTGHNSFEVLAGPPFLKRRIVVSTEVLEVHPGPADVAGGAVRDTPEGTPSE